MLVSRQKYEYLLANNEMLSDEVDTLRYLEETVDNNEEFLRWVNENIISNHIILHTFFDKQKNVSFIICNKSSYDQFITRKFPLELFAISYYLKPNVTLYERTAYGKSIPQATIEIRKDHVFLSEIRSYDFQKLYYGTALIDCIKSIMKHFGLNKIKAELGPSDKSANRTRWYKKNGFSVKEDIWGAGIAIYHE